MESTGQKRRFPPPWRVETTEHGFVVRDANGVALAHVYARDDIHAAGWSYAFDYLTGDEARRIAKAIARIPQLLKTEPGFDQRGHRRRYWRASHPYHVALSDRFINEQFDEIAACCRINDVPCEATGEIFERGGLRWRTYEFARQYDAIRFWNHFDGRWMVGNDFYYPARPDWIQPMRPAGIAPCKR